MKDATKVHIDHFNVSKGRFTAVSQVVGVPRLLLHDFLFVVSSLSYPPAFAFEDRRNMQQLGRRPPPPPPRHSCRPLVNGVQRPVYVSARRGRCGRFSRLVVISPRHEPVPWSEAGVHRSDNVHTRARGLLAFVSRLQRYS